MVSLEFLRRWKKTMLWAQAEYKKNKKVLRSCKGYCGVEAEQPEALLPGF